MTKIAVIVPIYNTESYLRECLVSIVAQTYTNLLIILVNDGSTDKSIDIAKEFAQNDERIIIIDKDNFGVSAARNAGLSILYHSIGYDSSSGGGGIKFIPIQENEILNEFRVTFKNQTPNSNQWKVFTKIKNPIQKTSGVKFVGFVDSDDVIKPHTYEKAIAPMEKDKCIDCVIFGAESFGEAEQERLEQLNEYLRIKYNGKVEINERLIFEITNNCWTKLFRFDLMQKYRLYFPPVKNGEDEVFKFYYLTFCKNVYFIDEKLYFYRQRKDSATSKFLGELDEKHYHIEILYNFKYIVEFYQKNELFDKKYESLCKIYVALVKSILWVSERKKAGEILDIVLKFGQQCFLSANSQDILNRNHLHQKFKFGSENMGHSKELLCVDLFGETIFEKRRCYFLHFFTRKFKILTTLYTNDGKFSYIKLGRKKLIIHKKAI